MLSRQVIHFLTNLLSRKYEFQADAFAVRMGKAADLKAGLLKLNHKNKSSPHSDPWFSAYHYSHPPLLERLQAIDEVDKKAN